MNEERIKELMDLAYKKLQEWNHTNFDSIRFPDRAEQEAKRVLFRPLIEIVAAEAREEGRKEGIDELRDALLEDWEGFVYEDDIKAKAERLKEKGR